MQIEVAGNPIVYFNGRYVLQSEVRIGILTHALHYGTGVFEGIRAYWNAEHEELYCFRMLEHYERWKQNCGLLHIDVPLSAEELCNVTLELLRRNNFHTDVYVRPLAYKSAERIGVSMDGQNSFALVAVPFGDYLPSSHGIHAGVSSWRRIDDNSIPARGKICGAYVNSVLASDEVKLAGFDEAILLNQDGHVAEGSTCNIFMVRKGQVITPSASENILEGITRDTILELVRNELHGMAVERPVDRSELLVCEELFFTGTAVGIAPVTRVNHRPVGNGLQGPIATELRRLYLNIVHGEVPRYAHWLMPVYGVTASSVCEGTMAGSVIH